MQYLIIMEYFDRRYRLEEEELGLVTGLGSHLTEKLQSAEAKLKVDGHILSQFFVCPIEEEKDDE